MTNGAVIGIVSIHGDTWQIRYSSIKRRDPALKTRIKRLARKTICYPHSGAIHEKVIDAVLERKRYNALNTFTPRAA
ncbi:IS1 family transposase [Zobellella aerophila]|uniref:Integrase DNA-binding domain-containing protein n=1 Tax=Zobellella aerophila TaxID=870480 RepID=A0ABP6WL75_9GAMM